MSDHRPADCYVAIIDAFSSGALLAPSITRLGIGVLHVQTSRAIDESLLRSFVSTDFEQCIDYQELGLSRTIDVLSRFPLRAVLPGCDSGVILADELSECLGVGRNAAADVRCRRSKFLMHEALRSKGLRAARQIKSESLEDILAWYARLPLAKVVIKPEFAARSEGVSFCENEAELIQSFTQTVGTTNLFGINNAEMVVQEYLPGPEYMVNTMSVNGRHFITDVWLGIDEQEEPISTDLYAELLHPGSGLDVSLTDYVLAVLDAVGMNTGPAHVEVRRTPNGPALIELGARLAGAMSPRSFQLAIGLDPVQLTVDAYLRPDQAIKVLESDRPTRHARLAYFHSDRGGTVSHSPDLSRMYALESVREVLLTVRKGDYMPKTSATNTRPGYAYLVHDDTTRLAADYEHFRAAERRLYESMLGS